MTSVSNEKRKVGSSAPEDSVLSTVLRYLLLIVLDAFALIFVYSLIATGNVGLGVVIFIATLGANIIAFVPSLGPLRWMLPGLFLATIFVIYPIYYTVATAFTNYGDGNLLTQVQAVNLYTNRKFAPEGATTYGWTLYQSQTDSDQFALWLNRTADDGSPELAFATQGEPIIDTAITDLDPPESYNDFDQLSGEDVALLLEPAEDAETGETQDNTTSVDLLSLNFGVGGDVVNFGDLIQGDFVPADYPSYGWSLYSQETDDGTVRYALALERDDEVVFAPRGTPFTAIPQDELVPPRQFEGYDKLGRRDMAPLLSIVFDLTFGTDEDGVGIRTASEAARPLQQRYTWDAEARTLFDNQTQTRYISDDTRGVFAPENGGEPLSPGYRTTIGFENFEEAAEDNFNFEAFEDEELNFFESFVSAFDGPLITIFIWTIVFAFLSVFTTFWLGLFMAIMLNDAKIPGKKIIRSLLIIPYAIPGVISIIVWRGMLNQNLGIVTTTLDSWIGYTVPWFDSPLWARVAIIIVNLWLGYPYMMLICSGALQAIPSDIYEAAAVDGATTSDRFWKITMPLLLVTVGPLLIASFVYNFNNFLLIDALTAGNPPILESDRPAGYTDILISYVYRLAFGNSRGADYGYASAITIIIFFLVAGITMFQYRFTKQWEEVGENV